MTKPAGLSLTWFFFLASIKGDGHKHLLLKFSSRPSIGYQTWLYLEVDPL